MFRQNKHKPKAKKERVEVKNTKKLQKYNIVKTGKWTARGSQYIVLNKNFAGIRNARWLFIRRE